ncbi:MAG: hypothetical protein RI957_1732, partial [Verrucomicrobiota bacterium]
MTDDGRAGGIRTHGLFVPNEARYQTALQPDVDNELRKTKNLRHRKRIFFHVAYACMTNRARSHQKNDVRMILANPASIVFYISRFITMFTIKFRTIAALVWTLLPFAAFAQAPNPPSNLNALIGAENGTNWNAELSWQDNASNETGFAFYKKSNLGYTYL